MSDEFENVKLNLYNAKQLTDIKENPVVKATILSLLKVVPIIGELIDSCMDVALTNFQQEKRNRLIEIILSDGENVTSKMVNDVEFIMNFAKTLEAVNRLATNDKVEYFGQLLRNSYFTEEKIKNNEFEEYLSILNVLSYREIQYICFLYNYQKENYIKGKLISDKNYFSNFGDKFGEHFGLGKYDYIDIFKKLAFTGFVQEFYNLYQGSISHQSPSEYNDEFTISGGEIDTDYFWITESFEKFVERIRSK